MSLVGIKGKFTLLPPYDSITSSGLSGVIVAVNQIHHMVLKGTNVERDVYQDYNNQSKYVQEYNSNVRIITIRSDVGVNYSVPELYIPNLNTDSTNYVEAYITVKVGSVPRNFDWSLVQAEISKVVSASSGVQVTNSDVFVSIEDTATLLTQDESMTQELIRKSNLDNSSTDYGKYLSEVSKNKVLGDKLTSVEQAIVKY